MKYIMFHTTVLRRRKTADAPIPIPTKTLLSEDSTVLCRTTGAPPAGIVLCTFFGVFLGTTVFPLRVSK
jgi:hypothetical protein